MSDKVFEQLRYLLDAGDFVALREHFASNPSHMQTVDPVCGHNLLGLAICDYNPEAVSVLLECGFDPNSKAGGFPALVVAVQKSDAELVELLLNHGADPDRAASFSKKNAKDWASQIGDRAILDLLRPFMDRR